MVIRIDRPRLSYGRPGGWRAPRLASLLAWLTLGILLPGAPAFAAAEKVGVAAEVNPDVTGQPPDEPLQELLIGHDVIRNEKIATQNAGQAQLLFTDQSTLTVARNSEVVIDEFVFDPNKQVGSLSAALTTGLFRYVGGKISKEKDITFFTPTGTVSVRGGIALIRVHGSTLQAIFVFGQRMTVTINGETQTATEPNTVIFTTDGRPSSPVPAGAALLDSFNAELQSGSNQTLPLVNEFAAEAPDLPPNFSATQSPSANPAPAPAPAITPAPTGAPAPALTATAPTPAPVPIAVSTPAPIPSATSAPPPAATPPPPAATPPPPAAMPPPPAATPTPPAATSAPPPAAMPTPPAATSAPPPAATPTPPARDHDRVDRDRHRDRDRDDEARERHHHHHRASAGRDRDDRDLRHEQDRDRDHRFADDDRASGEQGIDGAQFGRAAAGDGDQDRRERDDGGDRHGRPSGEYAQNGSDQSSERHDGVDRYVISDRDGSDDHRGEHQGLDRGPGAGGRQVHRSDHDGDPSHRSGREDGHHRSARDLVAFDRFRDAMRRSGEQPVPFWANGGRPYGRHHADRHPMSAHH